MKCLHAYIIRNILLLLPILSGLASCGMINDDLPPCETRVTLRFTDDYNMKFADAFAHEVKSVHVWAFDQEGKVVWDESREGDALASGNFFIDVFLPEGKYDFIAWCGMEGNDDFSLASSPVTSKADLINYLKTEAITKGVTIPDADRLSKRDLKPLFHGELNNVEISRPADKPQSIDIKMQLVKDTHIFRVMLHNIKGHLLNPDDFEIFITADNATLNYNNSWLQSPPVRYENWNKESIQTTVPDGQGNMTITSMAAMMGELTTSRLFYDKGATLTVYNAKEKRVTLQIDLLTYLVQARGTAHKKMPEQEFLDRNDEYSLIFFLDEHNDWYTAGGIYINNWKIVPPQSGDF